MIDKLGDIELESEYLVCQIIRGDIYPSEYVDVRLQFSSLEMVEIPGEIPVLLQQLKKMIITPFGIIDDKDVNKFSEGKHPKLLELVMLLKEEVEKTIPIYKQAFQDKYDDMQRELENNMHGQDIIGEAEAIKVTMGEKPFIDYLTETNLSLMKLSTNLEYIINDYGSFKIKLKKPKIKVGLNPDYMMYIKNIQLHPELVTDSSILAICLGRTIDAINRALPNIGLHDILDPFKKQESECILEVLTYPKDFYSKCENEEIVSGGVGTEFGGCYPAYYKKFILMYLEDFDKMDYQKQINFRKCFGIPEDNSQLLQLTSKYINLSYT